MPILPREVNIFPEDLLEASYVAADEARWLVVHTKPRQEKSLARDAVARSVPCYLPLVPKQSRPRGRTITSFSPLFAGYMFACVDAEQRLTLLQTNRVSRTVDVEDQELLTTQLRDLEKLIAVDAPLTIERKLQPGRAVRVKSGDRKSVV